MIPIFDSIIMKSLEIIMDCNKIMIIEINVYSPIISAKGDNIIPAIKLYSATVKKTL